MKRIISFYFFFQVIGFPFTYKLHIPMHKSSVWNSEAWTIQNVDDFVVRCGTSSILNWSPFVSFPPEQGCQDINVFIRYIIPCRHFVLLFASHQLMSSIERSTITPYCLDLAIIEFLSFIVYGLKSFSCESALKHRTLKELDSNGQIKTAKRG